MHWNVHVTAIFTSICIEISSEFMVMTNKKAANDGDIRNGVTWNTNRTTQMEQIEQNGQIRIRIRMQLSWYRKMDFLH